MTKKLILALIVLATVAEAFNPSRLFRASAARSSHSVLAAAVKSAEVSHPQSRIKRWLGRDKGSNVYAIQTAPNVTKYGVADNVGKRVRELQTGNPYKLQVKSVAPTATREQALVAEKTIHADNRAFRVGGEHYSDDMLK